MNGPTQKMDYFTSLQSVSLVSSVIGCALFQGSVVVAQGGDGRAAGGGGAAGAAARGVGVIGVPAGLRRGAPVRRRGHPRGHVVRAGAPEVRVPHGLRQGAAALRLRLPGARGRTLPRYLQGRPGHPHQHPRGTGAHDGESNSLMPSSVSSQSPIHLKNILLLDVNFHQRKSKFYDLCPHLNTVLCTGRLRWVGGRLANDVCAVENVF